MLFIILKAAAFTFKTTAFTVIILKAAAFMRIRRSFLGLCTHQGIVVFLRKTWGYRALPR